MGAPNQTKYLRRDQTKPSPGWTKLKLLRLTNPTFLGEHQTQPSPGSKKLNPLWTLTFNFPRLFFFTFWTIYFLIRLSKKRKFNLKFSPFPWRTARLEYLFCFLCGQRQFIHTQGTVGRRTV